MCWGLCQPATALAVITETSRSIYSFVGEGAERFRKLADPEVVLPVPAVFDAAVGSSIRCQMSAQRDGEPVKAARARLTVDLLILDLDAETFEVLAVGSVKIKTDATGFDTESFDFPSPQQVGDARPEGLVVRGRFALAGGKKADEVSARCSLESEKRLDRPVAAPAAATAATAALAGVESVSGTSSFLIDPPRKLKRIPNPQQLAAVPREPDDTLEVSCDAFALDRAGQPIQGARWTLLVELLVLDHVARVFEASPIAVESQVTDAEGRAFSGYQFAAEDFGGSLPASARSAWVLASLDFEGNKKAALVSSTCLVIRR